jgi:hypothetical protein
VFLSEGFCKTPDGVPTCHQVEPYLSWGYAAVQSISPSSLAPILVGRTLLALTAQAGSKVFVFQAP